MSDYLQEIIFLGFTHDDLDMHIYMEEWKQDVTIRAKRMRATRARTQMKKERIQAHTIRKTQRNGCKTHKVEPQEGGVLPRVLFYIMGMGSPPTGGTRRSSANSHDHERNGYWH